VASFANSHYGMLPKKSALSAFHTSANFGRQPLVRSMRAVMRDNRSVIDKIDRNKAIIIEVLTSAFTQRDFAAVERWFSPDYIQHNPFIPSSRAGLRDFVENLPKGRSYEPGMAVAEGADLPATA
jgi:hypothetical protein